MQLAHDYDVFGQCRWCKKTGFNRGDCLVVDPLAPLPSYASYEMLFEQGQEAGRFGYRLDQNPYYSPENIWWRDGFWSGQRFRRLHEKELNIRWGIS